MTYFVINQSDNSPPFHLTTDDLTPGLNAHRATPRTLTKRPLTRGQGGKIAVQCFTWWDELERSTWEYEEDLTQYGDLVFRRWARELVKAEGIARNIVGRESKWLSELLSVEKARDMRRQDIRCAVTTERGRFCVHLTSLLTRISILKRPMQDGSWRAWWGWRRPRGAKVNRIPLRCWTCGSEYNVRLSIETLTTFGEERGSRCWHVHQRGAQRTTHHCWSRRSSGGSEVVDRGTSPCCR